jgi:hypothetical protein
MTNCRKVTLIYVIYYRVYCTFHLYCVCGSNSKNYYQINSMKTESVLSVYVEKTC